MKKLTPVQARACRLEAIGVEAQEIARQCGVHPGTVSKWRSSKLYQERRDALMEAADEIAIDEARIARGEVMALGLEQLHKGAEALDAAKSGPEGDDPKARASLSNAALGWYRTLCGQTGVTEETRTTVEVSTSDQAREMLRRDLQSLTLEQLEALEAADGAAD